MEDKELKKRLKKIPDVDANGDPIYKIDVGGTGKSSDKKSGANRKKDKK